ncbi:uncharacterized protein BcabD6B2_09200 [Babesia caballi]|uniref:Uncharacterized protein n=1 Tax=Babesia caballi TaxID=5871 RepID=A0AAV4LPR3_BABCB|nr:hypothetical protein BcabD6B2_09200 [Babesia caballi]
MADSLSDVRDDKRDPMDARSRMISLTSLVNLLALLPMPCGTSLAIAASLPAALAASLAVLGASSTSTGCVPVSSPVSRRRPSEDPATVAGVALLDASGPPQLTVILSDRTGAFAAEGATRAFGGPAATVIALAGALPAPLRETRRLGATTPPPAAFFATTDLGRGGGKGGPLPT